MVMRLAWIVLLVGCRPSFELPESEEPRAEPIADAGTGTTVRRNAPITLDGSASFDLDGSIVSYEWSLVSAPPMSTATIVDNQAAITSFTPLVTGQYELSLSVMDDHGQTDSSTVSYFVIQEPLFVDAGADATIEWRKTAQLTAVVGVESGETPELAWSFVSKPSRSTAAILNPTTLTPSFVADADGTYVLELRVTTSTHESVDTVTITGAAQRVAFDGAFVDAVFVSDDETNRLVAVSDGPPRIRFINPVTGTETSLSLPSAPTAIAIDEYENNIAVATSGKIHIVDVFQGTLTVSHNVTPQVASLVFGPFGLVHFTTPTAGPIQTLDIANGTVTPSAFSVPAGTVLRHNANNNNMYGIEASTPRDLALYPNSVAPVTRFADSPYSGQYALGNDVWVRADTIVVGSGNVFLSHPYYSDDMTYRGVLEGMGGATVEYSYGYSPIVTLQSLSSTEHMLRSYDHDTLDLLVSAPLPDVMVNGVPQPATGRLIAYSPSYPNKIVIVASAGTSNAFIVTNP
jgi:hypothetical protein